MAKCIYLLFGQNRHRVFVGCLSDRHKELKLSFSKIQLFTEIDKAEYIAEQMAAEYGLPLVTNKKSFVLI